MLRDYFPRVVADLGLDNDNCFAGKFQLRTEGGYKLFRVAHEAGNLARLGRIGNRRSNLLAVASNHGSGLKDPEDVPRRRDQVAVSATRQRSSALLGTTD